MIAYLNEKEILSINYIVITKYSPLEDFGLKDPAALNACVELPKQDVYGEVLYPTLYDKAAILFEKLVNKHCFYNGNKRTAVMAVYIFLKRNGVQLNASNENLADMAVDIATLRDDNTLSIDDISQWLKKHSVPS